MVLIRGSGGVFNGDAETPVGWTNWASSGEIGFANFVADDSAIVVITAYYLKRMMIMLMKWYSMEILYRQSHGTWYKIGVWIKTEGVNTDTIGMLLIRSLSVITIVLV